MGVEAGEGERIPKMGIRLQDPLPNLYPSVHQHLVLCNHPQPPASDDHFFPGSGSQIGAPPGAGTQNTACYNHQAFLLPLQVEYLLKKVLSSMSLELSLGELEELLAQEAQAAQTTGGLSVWQFLELFNSGRCLRGVGRDTLSMAIHEVYQELIQDVLKQVRPSWELREDPKEGG